MLDSGCWILGAGFWVLDAGFWVLGTGIWDLGSGISVFVVCFWLFPDRRKVRKLHLGDT